MFFSNKWKTIKFFIFIATVLLLDHAGFAKTFHDKKAGPDIVILDNIKRLASGLPVNGETPASLACIYGLTTRVPGCPINGTSLLPNGGQGVTIAVTEGEDDPNAFLELTTFSATFGLPQLPLCTSGGPTPCFSVAYVNGVIPPPASSKVDLHEHALDIEWAHAMAPQASIIMVEGPSFSNLSDMLSTVNLASQLVANAGGGIVSNSWSFDEISNETLLDSNFTTPNIIYIASAGDYSAPARYPASSPYVIAAGGTSIQRDAAGNFTGERSWRNSDIPLGSRFSGGSGGPSKYESRPVYQNSVQKIVGSRRGTPDISFDADPTSGVALFVIDNDTGPSGKWVLGGGTSLAAPALAGIIASANSGAKSTMQELNIIYTGAIKQYHDNWNDILVGNNGFPCLTGYDFATGLGTPRGYNGK